MLAILKEFAVLTLKTGQSKFVCMDSYASLHKMLQANKSCNLPSFP